MVTSTSSSSSEPERGLLSALYSIKKNTAIRHNSRKKRPLLQRSSIDFRPLKGYITMTHVNSHPPSLMKHRLLPLSVALVAFTLTFLLSPTHRTAPAHKSPEEREDNAREMFEWWYNQRAF